MIWHLFDKPEYCFQPRFLWRRLFRHRRPGKVLSTITLPFGLPLQVDPSEDLGRSILTFGIYDLVLSEVIWRLADAGETVLDAGANIGYVTALLAQRVGSRGTVHSFEPHPEVLKCLRQNVASWQRARPTLAVVTVHPVALGAKSCIARLVEPAEFSTNRGTATLAARQPAAGRCFEVPVARLDDEMSVTVPIGLMKLDVEGHELDLLLGAQNLLSAGSVRDIVFEEHGSLPGKVAGRLQAAGYSVFTLDRTFWGPRLLPPDQSPRTRWLPTNLLATRNAARARQRLVACGWQVLRGC